MITLCIGPHIITGKSDDGWDKLSTRLTCLVVCIVLDAMYIVPMIG